MLVGNPNVGKSAIFSHLSGTYAEVSNFPGTTVEAMAGKWRSKPLIDAPGTYGLGDHSEEERITTELIDSGGFVKTFFSAAGC